jgi:membrane protein required for beta-lactamase induction
MRFELKINDKEVTNPIARFVFGLVAMIVGILVLILVLFVLLPVFWFFMLATILSVLIVLSSLPRLKIYYHDARLPKRVERQNSLRE